MKDTFEGKPVKDLVDAVKENNREKGNSEFVLDGSTLNELYKTKNKN